MLTVFAALSQLEREQFKQRQREGIETAKHNELDVYGYLLYLLTVLPKWCKDLTEAQLKSVMPWSTTLPAYFRKMYKEVQ